MGQFEDKIAYGISLFTAIKNRNKLFEEALKTWIGHKEIDEIIIVDWDSDESLIPLIEKYQNGRIRLAIVKDQKQWVLSKAFNLAARLTSKDRVLKIDADVQLLPDFFKKHQLKPNMFFSGNGSVAKDENESHLNGTAFLYREDFFKVNGYNEFIKNYGWDDTDLYSRLEALGLEHLDFSLDTLHHIEHENRTTYQARAQFSNQITDIEWARINILKNRYLIKQINTWSIEQKMSVFKRDRQEASVSYYRQVGQDENIIDNHLNEEAEIAAINDRIRELGISFPDQLCKQLSRVEILEVYNVFLENPNTFCKHPVYSLLKKYQAIYNSPTLGIKNHYAQLFIATTDTDYNETDSFKIDITRKPTILSFNLTNYNNIAKIRFDPANENTEVEIDIIRILSKGEVISENCTFSSNAFYQKDKTLFFNCSDPTCTTHPYRSCHMQICVSAHILGCLMV